MVEFRKRGPKDSATTEILTEGEINLQIHQIRFQFDINFEHYIHMMNDYYRSCCSWNTKKMMTSD